LKILKLSQNKIEFLNSTLNTIKNLRNLEELTIKENPFLTQLFGYKQYFIYNYQNILKLDEEEILDLDRDIAGRFVRENNIIYNNSTKRPMSSRPGIKSQSITKNINNLNEIEEDNEEEENNIFSQTQETFRVGNAIISKEMYVPYKGKEKKNKNPKIKKMQKKMAIKEKYDRQRKERFSLDKTKREEKMKKCRTQKIEINRELNERRLDIIEYQLELLKRGNKKEKSNELKRINAGEKRVISQMTMEKSLADFYKRMNELKDQSIYKKTEEERFKMYKTLKREEAERKKKELEEKLEKQ
jgi:hypothetical protein